MVALKESTYDLGTYVGSLASGSAAHTYLDTLLWLIDGL